MDPTSRVDVALLEYARHYCLAEDPITKSPESYLIDGGLDNMFPDSTPVNAHSVLSVRERHEELDAELGHYLNNERLEISMKEGRLLASARYIEQDAFRPVWNGLLPPLGRVSSARDEPLLKTQEEEERAQTSNEGDTMKLESKTDATAESMQSSKCMDQNQPRSASNSTAALVETALATSKTGKDTTPPRPARSSPAIPSTSTRHSSIRADLGSLDAFMESRGIALESPIDLSMFDYHTPSHLTASFGGNPKKTFPIPLMSPPSIPTDREAFLEDQVLFLSSDLLKTHLSFIQTLESLPNAPTLVYRDYDASENVEDADIIIPPMTGIILTTAQALTQRPLPGEEKENECLVLARIYRLAPGYEHFYVLVVSSQMVDSRTADALAFLKVFCGSVSDNAKVVPLIISSEEVVGWVLALAFERGERE